MRWGPEARGLGCIAGSQTPRRRPEDLPLPPPPPAVVEVERKGVGQGSQVTLGFCGERPENQADGREGGAALREGTRRREEGLVWSPVSLAVVASDF